MFKWLRERKARKLESRRFAGYSWAAGELLCGKPLLYVYNQAQCGKDFDGGAFDEGALQAVEDFCRLTKREMP
jgi:hypothetical protein